MSTELWDAANCMNFIDDYRDDLSMITTTGEIDTLYRSIDSFIALEQDIAALQAVIWQAAWRKRCADCHGTAETTWKDGTPLCFGCAYGRAGWESP